MIVGWQKELKETFQKIEIKTFFKNKYMPLTLLLQLIGVSLPFMLISLRSSEKNDGTKATWQSHTFMHGPDMTSHVTDIGVGFITLGAFVTDSLVDSFRVCPECVFPD